MKRLVAWTVIGMSLLSSGAGGQPKIFIDATPENTVRANEPPKPFFTEEKNSTVLWQREETGFDANETTAAYSRLKGDAPMLKTTAAGLEPGKTYGVYVCFISPPQFSWRIWAGFEAGKFDLFTPTGPQDRIVDMGGAYREAIASPVCRSDRRCQSRCEWEHFGLYR